MYKSGSSKYFYFIVFTVFYVFYNPTDSGAVELNSQNIDGILANNELVFINFYTEWCRFSNLLQPIFNDAADKVREEFHENGKAVLGMVDCDREPSLATRFHITKYPTLKIIRNGELKKREYRGQRSVTAFAEFVQKELEDPIKEFHSLEEKDNLDKKKRIIIGYFDDRGQKQYSTFRRVATSMKEDCQFHVGFGDVSKLMHPPGLDSKIGQPIIVFRPDIAVTHGSDETYTGALENLEELRLWVTSRCIPLVREITFENAEELTEEGLPFLILFHKPNDNQTIKDYKTIIENELQSEKPNINFLTADGERFAHPLHHLGKTQDDLPLIAVDSFRHMYLFPKFENMYVPGKLRQFLLDLHSGKLHREFHYGPDDDNEVKTEVVMRPTTPPESTFKKLGPSKNRYTLLKDEL